MRPLGSQTEKAAPLKIENRTENLDDYGIPAKHSKKF